MGPNYCNALQGGRAMLNWGVLLNMELQNIFLAIKSSPWIMPYVLTRNHMGSDSEVF